MGDVDTWSLIDFMPMVPGVYFRLFVRLNEGLWPWHWVSYALGMVVLWLAWRGNGRVLAVILGGCWLWVSWTFHFTLFAELNWAALYTGWAFVAQAVLLIVFGVTGRLNPALSGQVGFSRYAGSGLALFALVAYPLVIPVSGRAWSGVELFGTAPDPTVLVTLALLLLPQRVPWSLAIIPILWCSYSGAIWWAMGWYPGLIVPGFVLLWLAVATWKSLGSSLES
jgi:hypothetical protein